MDVTIRSLRKEDLDVADRVFRLAFGTYLGIPDPLSFGGDTDFIRTRWKADPTATLGAECGGELIGSNFIASWGSFGFFGPLTVRPDFWERGVAKKLLGPTMELFQSRGVRHCGLYTFAQSQKHVALYQKFGFWPRFLTAIMAKDVTPDISAAKPLLKYSSRDAKEKEEALAECRAVADAIFPGLDPTPEIRAVDALSLGETVLATDGDGIRGFGICHCGAGTEAGGGMSYVKFAAAADAARTVEVFDRLLDGCEHLTRERDLKRVMVGVNTGRTKAYQRLLARGYRTIIQGVAMHRPNEPAFSRQDDYVLDDWR